MGQRPRLVATDLDGTLLRSDGTLGRRTREVLVALEERGVAVVFVTGRPLRWAREVFAHVGGHGLAVVSNGALVWDVAEDRATLERPLGRDAGLEVVRRIRSARPASTFAVETAAGIDLEPSFLERVPVPEGSRRGPIEELFDEGVVKLLARDEEIEPEEYWRDGVRLAGELAVVTWSSTTALLEISAAGVTKASTLELLCAQRGIAAQEVAAFGDMPNDLPMLAWAGTSYAMANAHPDVRALADRRIGSNDEEGVAAVLEGLLD